jgi:hypothetical protein
MEHEGKVKNLVVDSRWLCLIPWRARCVYVCVYPVFVYLDICNHDFLCSA